MTTGTATGVLVREAMGLSTNDTAVTDAILLKLTDSAHRKISVMYDWPWLHATDATWTATTADQRIYVPSTDIAANWRKTLYIICDDEPLKLKQKQDIQQFREVTGRPRYYAAEGNEIILAPTPDAVYVIEHEYIYTPAAVTSGASEYAIYAWAIDLLVYQTAVLVARRLRDDDLRKEMEAELFITLNTIKDEVRRSRQLMTPKHRNDVGWS